MSFTEEIGVNGLKKFVLKNSKAQTSCEVYQHGAHLTSFKHQDRELLFMSPNSKFDLTSPIRGGTPLCFPRFSQDPGSTLPQHGFARTSNAWIPVEGRNNSSSPSASSITLRLSSKDIDPALHDSWIAIFDSNSNNKHRRDEYDWHVLYSLTLQDDGSLRTDFSVSNNTNTKLPIEFTMALHTYFRLESTIRSASVLGVADSAQRYTDKVLQKTLSKSDAGFDTSPISFVGETDRVYFNTANEHKIRDGDQQGENTNTFTIYKSDELQDTVVWNAWADRAAKIADLGENNYLHYVCVEVARIGNPVRLNPGQSWSAHQIVSFSSSNSSSSKL